MTALEKLIAMVREHESWYDADTLILARIVELQQAALLKVCGGYSLYDFKTGETTFKEYPETILVRQIMAEAEKVARGEG